MAVRVVAVQCCRRMLVHAVALGLTVMPLPVFAHHSRAMFDVGRNITYRGVVKEYRWQNPHTHIVITVPPGTTDRSTVGTWVVEASATDVMTSRGWTSNSYRPGDPITVVAHPNTVVAHPNSKGSNLVLLFYAVKADGVRLYRATHRYPGEVE